MLVYNWAGWFMIRWVPPSWMALSLLLALGTAHALSLAACDGPGVPDRLISSLFAAAPDGCDINGDGRATAADVTAALIATIVPTATATPEIVTPSPTAPPLSPTLSSTATVTPSATPTGSATVTPTSTMRSCPTAGANLVLEVDNRTGQPAVTVALTGERLADDCVPGGLATGYSVDAICDGIGVTTCASVGGLATGWWKHSIVVTQPQTGQVQHRAGLLVSGMPDNAVRFTAFASVLTVRSTANTGRGSLREALQSAETAVKPLLVQFDPLVFPPGIPTAVVLNFQLPAIATDDVTIDGIDATGTPGNRVIDAGGIGIAALVITGARNHVVGLRLGHTGGNDRDTLNITGAAADGNVVEDAIVEQSGSADAVGIDNNAGKDFGDLANVIRDSEIRSAADKGVKVTLGAYARVENCWVHDNANGGIQATLGGHVQTRNNLVEHNLGSTAQNGLSVNARDDNVLATVSSELHSSGDISRGNGANGLSVRASMAQVRDGYFATNATSGIRVFNDVGAPASALIEGTSAVCNGVDGATVANTSSADFGGGELGSTGNNAFTQNNLPSGGSNLHNATTMVVDAINAQWEHCGPNTTCNDDAIAAFDLADHGTHTPFTPSQAHRSLQPPLITGITPATAREGDLVRIFGSGFNVIDGHFSETACADVRGRNRCVPLRGNCVKIDGVSAPVEAVTPTMLVVRWPLTCLEPVPLVVTTDQGSTGVSSTPYMVCVNEIPSPTATTFPTATPSASPSPTPTPSESPLPTSTPSASPPSTPTPSETALPMSTASMIETPSTTPTPVATP